QGRGKRQPPQHKELQSSVTHSSHTSVQTLAPRCVPPSRQQLPAACGPLHGAQHVAPGLQAPHLRPDDTSARQFSPETSRVRLSSHTWLLRSASPM
ncbi:MAG: hypothetical protein ACPIOQ_41205, partial [Promethearchaeia archaeon]